MEKPLLETMSENELEANKANNKLEYRYNVNCLDKLTYGWVFPVLQHGYKHTMTQEVL